MNIPSDGVNEMGVYTAKNSTLTNKKFLSDSCGMQFMASFLPRGCPLRNDCGAIDVTPCGVGAI
jgi:hypothetical protein